MGVYAVSIAGALYAEAQHELIKSVDFGCAREAGMLFDPAQYCVEILAWRTHASLHVLLSYQTEMQTCRGVHMIRSSAWLLTLFAHVKLECWSICI